MSTLRERLAALRARRDSHPATTNAVPTVANPDADAEQQSTPPKPAGSNHTQATRLEWRARAMKHAKERVRRAALDSGVYDVITRPLPREKDDIEELEKRRREELAHQAEHAEEDEDDDEDEDVEPGDEVDEEEAALLELNNGEDTRDETRDAGNTKDDTRDAIDTRDGPEDTRETEGGHERGKEDVRVEQVSDEISTAQVGEKPESVPIAVKACDEEPEQLEKVGQGESDDAPPREPKPAPISETGPEMVSAETPEDTPPETPEQTPMKAVPRDVTPPRNPLGMVEDEAEDDQDDEVENHSPDLSGDEVNDIVPDAEVGEQEAAKLADFHRKWETEQMEPAAPRYDDLDDAMDFTNVKAASDEPIEGISAESGVAADGDRANNYIDAMYADPSSCLLFRAEPDVCTNETLFFLFDGTRVQVLA